jgi:hypothetical protein
MGFQAWLSMNPNNFNSPPTPTVSLTPTSQVIHNYINRANGSQSHITTLMMERELVSETMDFTNLLTWLSAQENFEFCCCKNFTTDAFTIERCNHHDFQF